MKPPHIALEHITALPLLMQMTVPDDYRDTNDHMNVRHYLTLFDEAGYPMYERLGLTPDFLTPRSGGGFDLEHHISYLNEVRVGETVTLHARMVARTAKRMHYLMFMVNATQGKLAAIFECVNSYADLSARRTAPWPPEIAAAIDAMLAEAAALHWPAPVCGVMSA